MIIPYNHKNKEYARTNRHQYFMTEAEGKMRNLGLRKDTTGYRFLRQKLLGNYILDFYCDKLKLGIEIDGESHNGQGGYDDQRTNYLKKFGIKIIRYTNNQIYYQLDGVLIDLNSQIEERAEELGLINKILHPKGYPLL
ncbi:MAG: endonuclease domain-containing protein [candidate division SR1 bacterium]|nr:endonuclease domain-containing protein [candidate division SR1 bacterium]